MGEQTKEIGLHSDHVDELKRRIEEQWVYHRIIKSLFPHHRKKEGKYDQWNGGKTSSFHHLDQTHIAFGVKNHSDQKIRPYIDEMGRWMNENFIIRLYGVLDDIEYPVYKKKNGQPQSLASYEKEQRSRIQKMIDGGDKDHEHLICNKDQKREHIFYSVITTISDLRNRVGAHQSTENEADSTRVRCIREDMIDNLGLELEKDDSVQYFNLNITKVLEPLKNMAMKRVGEYRL